MDKKILMDYIDACKLVEETEQDIRKLNKRKTTCVQENVKGSMPDFPYAKQHFKVEGTAFTYGDDVQLRWEEKNLKKRKEIAECTRMQVMDYMNAIPMRMQRVVRYKYFDRLTWEKVADRMGGKATGDSVRMELNKFLKEEK